MADIDLKKWGGKNDIVCYPWQNALFKNYCCRDFRCEMRIPHAVPIINNGKKTSDLNVI